MRLQQVGRGGGRKGGREAYHAVVHVHEGIGTQERLSMPRSGAALPEDALVIAKPVLVESASASQRLQKILRGCDEARLASRTNTRREQSKQLARYLRDGHLRISGCMRYCVLSMAWAYLHWSTSRVIRLRPYPLRTIHCRVMRRRDTKRTCPACRGAPAQMQKVKTMRYTYSFSASFENTVDGSWRVSPTSKHFCGLYCKRKWHTRIPYACPCQDADPLRGFGAPQVQT
jgi:hypothetical protein